MPYTGAWKMKVSCPARCTCRRAASYHIKAQGYKGSMQRRAMAFSYALAVAEENASGSVIVTAPTCGVWCDPSVLYLNQTSYNFPK